MTAKKVWLHLHTFLIASYPTISLLSTNIGQVTWGIAIRPLFISLALALTLLGLLYALRIPAYRSILASLLLALFSSYGHVYGVIESAELFGVTVGRHRYLLPLWIFIGSSLGYALVRYKPSLQTQKALNFTTLILVALPVLNLTSYFIGQYRFDSGSLTESPLSIPGYSGDNVNTPDIYYIILDEYPRQDVLLRNYSFDNSAFLSQLEELGFLVGHRSMSNYAHTDLSLASSLNMDYLSSLLTGLDPSDSDRSYAWNLIQNNRIRKYFELRGYRIVAFETGYAWSQWEDADAYLGPAQGYLSRASLTTRLTEFEIILLRQSAFLLLEDLGNAIPSAGIPKLERRAKTSYEQVLYILDELPDVPTVETPSLIFAHLIVPHPPYTYSVDGEYIGDMILEEYGIEGEDHLYNHNTEGHRRSVEFISKKIIDVVGEILSNNHREAIIILQADTGPPGGSREDRMAILYGLYLDGYDSSLFSDDLTPVNTFRVILNSVFDEELPLLEDHALYSPYNTPYDFHLIPKK